LKHGWLFEDGWTPDLGPGLKRDFWNEAHVNAKLREILVRAFDEVEAMARREQIDMLRLPIYSPSSGSSTPLPYEACTRKPRRNPGLPQREITSCASKMAVVQSPAYHS
jgi:hypothetical protein